MKNKTALIMVMASLALTACTGPGEMWEPKTFGVRNSKWSLMSSDQQYAAEQIYHENQRLAEQRKLNELKLKQNKQYAKKLHKAEKEQQKRLKQELDHLKKRLKNNENKQEDLSNSVIVE